MKEIIELLFSSSTLNVAMIISAVILIILSFNRDSFIRYTEKDNLSVVKSIAEFILLMFIMSLFSGVIFVEIFNYNSLTSQKLTDISYQIILIIYLIFTLGATLSFFLLHKNFESYFRRYYYIENAKIINEDFPNSKLILIQKYKNTYICTLEHFYSAKRLILEESSLQNQILLVENINFDSPPEEFINSDKMKPRKIQSFFDIRILKLLIKSLFSVIALVFIFIFISNFLALLLFFYLLLNGVLIISKLIREHRYAIRLAKKYE